MKIFVTGGAGYIGSVMVEQLIAEGDDVVVFDNLTRGHKAAVHPNAHLIVGDLLDRDSVDRALAQTKPDAVLHFASHSQVGESMEKPLLYLGDNVAAGRNLLEGMVKNGVKKFIFSSTAALFGHPEKIPISENERIAPDNPYGESKRMIESMLPWLDRIHGLRYACLRYFNAAGASAERGEDHTPETHLIPLVLQVALGQRKHVTVFGDDYPTRDGSCVRDYVHIADLAQAHILALRALDEGSRVYNLGNGEGFSVKEVIETARQITGHPIPCVMGARRAGDPAELVASSEKIRKELGWKPAYPNLRDIMESAWKWHQTHPQGYSL